MNKRMQPDDRRDQILKASAYLAAKEGYLELTRAEIAKRVRCTPGLITHYFGSMNRLRTEVMQLAVREEALQLIAQGLTGKHPVALRAPEALRRRAAMSVVT